MNEQKLRQQLAQSYLKWRAAPPGLKSLLPKYLLLWAITAVAISVLVALAYWLITALDVFWFAIFAAGLLVGAIARDIGWARRFVKHWPHLAQLLDWQQVEQQAAAAPPAAVSEPVARRSAPRRVAMIVAGAVIFFAIIGVVDFADRWLLRANNPLRSNAPQSVVIYTTTWCGYCAALREYLRNAGIPHTEHDVEESIAGMFGFRAVDGSGVPVTVVGQQVIHGYRAEQIQGALLAAGYKTGAKLPSPELPAPEPGADQ